ncbi:MAG: hypothetical protein V7731_16140 [Amphritea sp.]
MKCLVPNSMQEAMQFSEFISNTSLIPKDFRGKPGDIFVAIGKGMEVGLKPFQALESIAVVNGRAAMWGDALVALVRQSGLCEYIKQEFDENTMTATCRVKRKGEPEEVRTFSRADAELAGLWGRNTWKQYPKRMLANRARAFVVRDVFADVLMGMGVAEEIQDYQEPRSQVAEKDITPQDGRPSLEHYPADDFKANFPKWEKVIQSGKKSPDDIITMVSSKGLLTEEQQNQIKQVAA